MSTLIDIKEDFQKLKAMLPDVKKYYNNPKQPLNTMLQRLFFYKSRFIKLSESSGFEK